MTAAQVRRMQLQDELRRQRRSSATPLPEEAEAAEADLIAATAPPAPGIMGLNLGRGPRQMQQKDDAEGLNLSKRDSRRDSKRSKRQ